MPTDPTTGLAAHHPTTLLTDEDLERLAAAEVMFRVRTAAVDASTKPQQFASLAQIPARMFAALARMAN
jgi:hypothetical protein